MKYTLIFCVVLFASCKQNGNNETGNSMPDQSAFDSYKESFIEDLWKIYPDWATGVGYHKYDSVLYVPDESFRNMQIAFAEAHLDSLDKYSLDELSDLNKIDRQIMENFLKKIKWDITRMKAFEWDPSFYNVCGTFSFILSETYEPLDARLKNLNIRLANVPQYYSEAKKLISHPSAEHLQLAIDQNLGGVSVFEKDLIDSANASTLDAETKATLIQRSKDAAAAVHDFATFLKQLDNPEPRSFRLGKELYPEKFAFEIESDYRPEQIFDSAVQRKEYLHGEMEKISRQLWPKYFAGREMPSDRLVLIRMMIDTLSANHTEPDAFQTTIEKQIPELVDFINEKNLIYIDPSKPLKVRKEPGYMAGVAGASISSPGPYDKDGNTYYNVGSLEGWSKERAESYLREYNDYILQILNIHEAIPGHYTQLVYSNNSPSIIKSILGNGAMIEGWAVYGELMMLENGYGNNEPEMWLMYYKWNLRTVCNTILDISVHTKDMSKEDALDLLVRQAFQQQAEAEGKWRRVNVTNVQLCSYYTGFKEIYDLREEYRKMMGDAFNLKTFHEKFLSYGSVPVKYIREMMLKDAGKKTS